MNLEGIDVKVFFYIGLATVMCAFAACQRPPQRGLIPAQPSPTADEVEGEPTRTPGVKLPPRDETDESRDVKVNVEKAK